MSGPKNRLEEIIEASLEEAKKKAKHKMHGKKHHEEEGEEEEEEEEEFSEKPSKKMKKMEEAKKYEEEESGKKPSKKMKKMEEAKKYEEEEEEKEESGKNPPKKMKKMEEETMAASSLHPAARAITDPKAISSKTAMMGQVMGAMSSMPKSDMINFFNQVMGQYGPGHTYGVGDNSESNKSTLNMKPSDAPGHSPDIKMPMPKLGVREDVEEMFVGEDLSEEFKEKASTLFEAAINARLTVELARLEEQYSQTISEEIQAYTESITDKIDAYLDYVVENWVQENKVAIESTLRNEIMEEFIDGLKGLFVEHYIEVPESKIDVIESLAEKVDSLEQLLDETITENSEMKSILSDVAKKEIFEELASDLALTQQEKFSSLAEGIEFDGNVDGYTKKLRIIKETYFNNEQVTSTNIEEETFEGEVEQQISTNPLVNKYVQALSRTVKK